MQQQFVMLTPKAMRVQQLRAEGWNFDKALTVADAEFTSDGLTRVRDIDAMLSDLLPISGALTKEVTF